MNPPPVSVIAIARIVADHYGVTIRDITSHGRSASLVRPRHVVMYLAREHTNLSYPQIGRRLGGRDHTTIMHGVGRIESARAEDRSLARDIAIIEQLIEVERRALMHFGLGLEPDLDTREIAERVLSTRQGEFSVSAREVILLAEAALAAAIKDDGAGGAGGAGGEAGGDGGAALAELIGAVGTFVDATGRAARAHNGEERILTGEERNSAFAKLLSTYRDLAAAREAANAKETEHA